MATITTTNILLVYADSMEDIMALIIMTHIIPIFIGIIMTLIIMAFLFITPIHGGIDHTDIATGAGVGTILTIIITAGVILIIAPMVGVILTTMDMADMAGDITTDTTMVTGTVITMAIGMDITMECMAVTTITITAMTIIQAMTFTMARVATA